MKAFHIWIYSFLIVICNLRGNLSYIASHQYFIVEQYLIGGKIALKMKSRKLNLTWKLNLAAGIGFWVAALLYLIDIKYSLSVIYLICGLLFFISSRINYKKYKNN
jgi:hypothetical protein